MGGLSRVTALCMVAACYQPAPPSGIPCTDRGDCPGDQACVIGVCGGTLGTDAPVMPGDAPTDGAPNQIVMITADQMRDAEIWSDYPTTNYGAGNHMSVDSTETSLVWFDLTSIASDAVVVSATLRVATSDFASADNGTVFVHRLREAWVESQATWTVRATGQPWSISGALPPVRDLTSIAQLQPAALNTSYEVALPAALVQDWITQPATNYGIAIVRGTSAQHVHLATRETGAGSSLRVELSP